MKYFPYILLSATILTGACSHDGDEPGVEQRGALHIDHALIGKTRAGSSDRTFSAGDTIGLFLLNSSGAYGTSQNVPALYNGDSWEMLEYVPVPRYSNDLYAVGYYPYSKKMDEDILYIPNNGYSQNVLRSFARLNYDGGVDLYFQHMLVKLVFNFSVSQNVSGAGLTDIRLVSTEGIAAGMTSYYGFRSNTMYLDGIETSFLATYPIESIPMTEGFALTSSHSVSQELLVPEWNRVPLELNFNLDGVAKRVVLPKEDYRFYYSYTYNIIIDEDHEVTLQVGPKSEIVPWEQDGEEAFEVQ